MVSIISDSVGNERPTPADFDSFLPWASSQLEGRYTLIITRTIQSKYVGAKGKPKVKPKTKTSTDSGSQMPSDTQLDSKSIVENSVANPIYMEVTYDECDNLVSFKFTKNNKIPRKLLKIIALAIPYHRTLTSITINGGLHAEAIYEISNYFSTNRITEICLDKTLVAEANYHILLDNNKLKHLSLAKCNITDVVVKTIASKLIGASPASDSLSILNLSSNRITDVGAKYLGETLRVNRQLTYLNLADNRLTDEGAQRILNSLTKFILTDEETEARSKFFMTYLNQKNELIIKTILELRMGDDKRMLKKKSTKLITAKKKLDKDISIDMKNYNILEGNFFDRAEAIADEILGPFCSPFSPENTEKGNGVLYCLGNNTLSYLNLAFNDLSYSSVKKLCEVLQYQKSQNRKPKGLINVRIEGNYLPVYCKEFRTIDELLLPGLATNKNMESVKRRAASSVARSYN